MFSVTQTEEECHVKRTTPEGFFGRGFHGLQIKTCKHVKRTTPEGFFGQEKLCYNVLASFI
jgi:hypothetical protein